MGHDIYEKYREDAKSTPFFYNGHTICRCGRATTYVPESINFRIDSATAVLTCQNPECGAKGLLFEIKLVPVEGRVVLNANF